MEHVFHVGPTSLQPGMIQRLRTKDRKREPGKGQTSSSRSVSQTESLSLHAWFAKPPLKWYSITVQLRQVLDWPCKMSAVVGNTLSCIPNMTLCW